MDDFYCKISMQIDNAGTEKDEFKDVKSNESEMESDHEINHGIVLSLEALQEKEITLKH
mgnify:CR=1 FL=1